MDNSTRIIEVDINDVLPNRNQPRIILNEEDDLGLTDSVREYGVLQPIIVRTIGDKYEIIAGERRYRASVLAGKETVPVIVRNMSDKESAEIALIENVQRKQLTPIEEALSYKNILDKGYMTQEELAQKIGKSQPTIANKIRLLNLSDEVQEALLENQISERHARSLLKIRDRATQNKMLDRIISERLTVRKTDEEIGKLIGNNVENEGEDKMNNNEFINMPQFQNFADTTAPAAPVAEPQVNIFADQAPVAPVAPVAPETPAAEPQFNIFADAPATTEPVAPAPVAEPQFDIFADQAPAAPAQPAPAVEPQFNIFADAPATTEPVAPAPAAEPQFNLFADQAPAAPAQPAPAVEEIADAEPIVVNPALIPGFVPTTEEPATVAEEVPNVEPIVVNPAMVPDFTTADIQDPAVPAAPAAAEPIIITDYNKQYDPVMPQAEVQPAEPVNFKEVIAAIRECAEKIESYGYKIDVDEFDLTNIYQAIFKIEKM